MSMSRTISCPSPDSSEVVHFIHKLLAFMFSEIYSVQPSLCGVPIMETVFPNKVKNISCYLKMATLCHIC